MGFNPFKTKRIDVVFFFGFGLIVTVLVGAIIWINYTNGAREVAESTSYYQQRILVEMHKKLATTLGTIEQSSNTASQNFNVLYESMLDERGYDQLRIRKNIRAQLNNYVFGMPVLHSIHVYSNLKPSYNVQEFVQFLPIEQVYRESWHGDIDNSDYTWISERTIKAIEGEIPVISFARKVYNNYNKTSAIVVLNVRVPVFQSLIASDNHPTNIALLDATDKAITHIGDVSFFASHTDEILTDLDQEMAGARRTGDNFVVWSSSADSKWTLIEISSWKEMTAGSLIQSKVILLLGLITVLLILVLAVLLSRQFIKPIAILLKAMNNYTLNRPVILPKDYKNEFGHLFKGYERLISRIEELYASLEEQHKLQRASEIKALQMMINPHFLYNSLDQINWTAIEAGQSQISGMLSHLGQFLRLSLSNGNSLVRVSEEINHIHKYLQFQKLRWEDRLSYSFEIAEETQAWLIPKITLQPFVENAFVHGFHGVRHAFFKVRIASVNDRLEISIENNGLPLREDWKDGQSRQGGYGLRLVSDRIKALFGPNYGFDLHNLQDGGVEAVIYLPIITSPADGEVIHNVENRDHR